MIEREDVVVAVVAAAEGPLYSRVRLQKVVYLLDKLGLGSNFQYEYAHFGPYSRDLDNATADAKAFGLVEEKFGHRESDGGMYSIFELKGEPKPQPKAEAYGGMAPDIAKKWVQTFTKTNLTVLELAATVDWLWRHEKQESWEREITKRKGLKVQGGRLEKAIDLLKAIDLAPPPPA